MDIFNSLITMMENHVKNNMDLLDRYDAKNKLVKIIDIIKLQNKYDSYDRLLSKLNNVIGVKLYIKHYSDISIDEDINEYGYDCSYNLQAYYTDPNVDDDYEDKFLLVNISYLKTKEEQSTPACGVSYTYWVTKMHIDISSFKYPNYWIDILDSEDDGNVEFDCSCYKPISDTDIDMIDKIIKTITNSDKNNKYYIEYDDYIDIFINKIRKYNDDSKDK